MILDERNEFADAASVAGSSGTALIGDVINLGAAHRDIGQGQPLYLVITVATAIVTGTSTGTISFSLASDAQAAIATDGSATEHITVGPFATATTATGILDAGSVVACVALPSEGAVYEQYLGILATIGSQAVSAGAINAFLTLDPTGWKPYPEGTN